MRESARRSRATRNRTYFLIQTLMNPSLAPLRAVRRALDVSVLVIAFQSRLTRLRPFRLACSASIEDDAMCRTLQLYQHAMISQHSLHSSQTRAHRAGTSHFDTSLQICFNLYKCSSPPPPVHNRIVTMRYDVRYTYGVLRTPP